MDVIKTATALAHPGNKEAERSKTPKPPPLLKQIIRKRFIKGFSLQSQLKTPRIIQKNNKLDRKVILAWTAAKGGARAAARSLSPLPNIGNNSFKSYKPKGGSL
jgi:hypothetical protein